MAQGRSGMPMAPVGGFGQQQQGGFMPQRQLGNFGPYRQGMMGEPGMNMNGFNSGFNRQVQPMSSGPQMPNAGQSARPMNGGATPQQGFSRMMAGGGMRRPPGIGDNDFLGGATIVTPPPMASGGPVAPPAGIMPPMNIGRANESTDRMMRENPPMLIQPVTGGPVAPPSQFTPVLRSMPGTFQPGTVMDGGGAFGSGQGRPAAMPVTGDPMMGTLGGPVYDNEGNQTGNLGTAGPRFDTVLNRMPGTVADGNGAFGQGRPLAMPFRAGGPDSQPAVDAMARDFEEQETAKKGQTPIQRVKPLPGTLTEPTESLAPIEPKGDIFQQAATGIGQAIGGAQREMGYQPPNVFGSRYSADRVTPGGSQYTGDVTTTGYKAPSIAENIGQFVNPFEQQVVEGTLGDIERQRQMQANQLAAQFQGARAFGGSREAIQQAELGRQAFEQGTSASSALRQQGFGQALQSAAQQAQMGQRASEFGLNQNLQAQLANQAARQRFGEFGAGQSLQAQLANQSARARANEFGLGQNLQAQLANQAARQAGSQQRLSAASQLGSLANLGFGMGQTVQNQMAQQGALQQQLQQQIMNAARSQFEGFRNYPAQALGYYAQALGATPTPQSSTTSKQPGLFDYLTLGASLMG